METKIREIFLKYNIKSRTKILFICGTLLKRRIKDFSEINKQELSLIDNSAVIKNSENYYDNNVNFVEEQKTMF